MNNPDPPRNKQHGDKPGAFSQCLRISQPVLRKPGESMTVEHFFSGYGEISCAKVFFYPSREVLDYSRSKVVQALEKTAKGFQWGAQIEMLTSDNQAITFQGMFVPGWDAPTSFFDVGGPESYTISTEHLAKTAPLQYELVTRKGIRPGTYQLRFAFTYYNGERWVSNNEQIEFRVQNFLERNSLAIGCVATIASLAAIVSLVVSTLGN